MCFGLTRFHIRTVLVSGVGFFTDAYDLSVRFSTVPFIFRSDVSITFDSFSFLQSSI